MAEKLRHSATLGLPLRGLETSLQDRRAASNRREGWSIRLRLCYAVSHRVRVGSYRPSIHEQRLKRRSAPAAKRVENQITRTGQFVDPSLDERFRKHRKIRA